MKKKDLKLDFLNRYLFALYRKFVQILGWKSVRTFVPMEYVFISVDNNSRYGCHF